MTMKGSSELFYDKSNRANATYSGTRNASQEPTPQPRPIALTNSPTGSGKRITASTGHQICNYMKKTMSIVDFLDRYGRTVSADTQFNIDTDFIDDQAARYMAIKELADELNIVISDLDSF